MASIDVLLKGTDDCASSGFFHLKVSLRHRLKKTSPCLTSPRASAEPLRAYALQGLACLAIYHRHLSNIGSTRPRRVSIAAGESRDAGSSSF
ncbi:hypothetical protein [Salisediminibacterium halotolerans]|uniref:hypothetical protein n=1 Tax=Salisediminibacterium halotolerans TaxID=517425 RepID=UPI00115FCF35|nr:hypothetical protein [Salisediminibacterium haloalkalitolerans]